MTEGIESLQPKKRAVLAAYVECGHVGRSCEAAGISRVTHYRWLKEDGNYANAYQLAQEIAASTLEDEARRRAVEGVRKLKFHQGEPILDPDTGEPYFEHDYSDTLLIFLMKAAWPERFRERYEHKHSGEIKTDGSVRVLLDKDWYGNSERIAAGTAAASIESVDVTESVQSPGVRPKVGQNGHGSNGNGHRPRPE